MARCTGLGIPDSSGSAQFVIGEFLILKDRPARLDRPKKSTTIAQAWVRSFLAIVFFNFYAWKAHIMYLTVSACFLISFVMGGSGPSRAIKLLYAPAPPPPTV